MRIVQWLTSKEKLSFEDFQQMQLDVVSLQCQQIAKHLQILEPKDDRMRRALEKVANWDFAVDADSVAASICHVFYTMLFRNTLADELGGELFEKYIEQSFLAYPSAALEQIMNASDSHWVDNIQTPDKEDRAKIIEISFQQALDWLEKRLGKRMDNWRWGRVHKVTFEHQILGEVPLINRLFRHGPFEIGGDSYTINKQGFKAQNPYDVTSYCASYRQIIDFSDLSKSVYILPPGQSGQFLSKHFDDMMKMWMEGKYYHMFYDTTTIKENQEALLTLVPGGR